MGSSLAWPPPFHFPNKEIFHVHLRVKEKVFSFFEGVRYLGKIYSHNLKTDQNALISIELFLLDWVKNQLSCCKALLK